MLLPIPNTEKVLNKQIKESMKSFYTKPFVLINQNKNKLSESNLRIILWIIEKSSPTTSQTAFFPPENLTFTEYTRLIRENLTFKINT